MLFVHIFIIDKNKYDEYIGHMYCVHYHILLSNIVSWVAKRHIDMRVNSRNFRMLKASIIMSNIFLCDSLLCIHSSKKRLDILLYNIMEYPWHGMFRDVDL